MKELIKYIRNTASLSQAQFAAVLGTTPLSVNRWENGKTVPNNMAQKQLYEFCANRNINIVDKIIKDKARADNNGSLILYHGSKHGIEGKISPISREECDFGKGFYMGEIPLQPLSLVCSEENPVFYTLQVNLNGLKVLNINVDIDWAMVIAYNRKEMESAQGTSIYDKYSNYLKGYDVVNGYIADDRMYTELSRFFTGNLTDLALIKCLSALDLGKQYVALTEKACSQIEIIEEKPLCLLERMALSDYSVKRRKQGISLAADAEYQYRREGRFFDEILKEGL